MVRMPVFYFIAFLIMVAPLAYADVPRLISIQGRLTDSFGTLITSPTQFNFTIYDAAGTGTGNAVWSELQIITPDSDGIFSELLGSVEALDIPFDIPYWLEVKIGAEILEPRQQIGSAAYSIRSENPWNMSGNDIYNTNAGNVGIGTSTPESVLHIVGDEFLMEGGSAEINFIDTDIGHHNWRIGTGSSDYLSIALMDENNHDLTLRVPMIFRNNGGAGGTTNVGIGTTNPQATLHVVDSSSRPAARFVGDYITVEDVSSGIRFVDTNDNRYWQIHNTQGHFDFEYTADNGASWADKVVFDKDGDVGIGVLNPLYQLHLSANSAAKPTSSSWTVVSDERLKKDIEPFTDGLNVITKINPVSYKLNGKAGTPENAEGISIIAQDIQEIAPYTVSSYMAKLEETDTIDTELYDFDSSSLTFVLINAVKEQQEQIELLQEEIALLKNNN